MTTQAEQLLSEFPEHTYEQWHAAAVALLKGAPFEKMLVSSTYEDITIQPIYRQEDIAGLEHRKHFPGSGSLVRGSHAAGFLKLGWEISQELDAASVEEFNRIAHEGLAGGQSELNIPTDRWPASTDLTALKTALSGITLNAISIWWRGANSLPFAALFFAAIREIRIDPKSLRGCFDNDPFAEIISDAGGDLKTRFDHIAALTRYAQQHAPGIRTITVRGDVYHNAGATATQELAYVVATLVSYMEEMKSRGLSPESVLPHVRICLAVGSDYFMEISKLRAARWLWSKVAEAYGVENAPIQLHASTSWWNKTTYDAHSNMLRVTAEAFAAVVAGVDSLHIGPFDEISGHTDEFSRRIARNVHIILREECGLDRVIDPAGGSAYIEWLTDQIAAKSWGIFQGIEQQGGMLAGLENGSVQQAVGSVCQAKLQNVRRRKDKIVGSNMYPYLKGGKLEIKPRDASPVITAEIGQPFDAGHILEQAIDVAIHGATLGQIAGRLPCRAPSRKLHSLTSHRAAEEYEALRDASAAFAGKTGAPPAILQLNIGPSGRYRLRADWTASFFEAAGFTVDGTRDFADVGEAVKALSASKATIAVITSDDATYLESVAPLAAAVKAARPEITLLVAGAPGDNEAAWRAAGVDEFVNVRSNNYELNEQLLKKAGVF